VAPLSPSNFLGSKEQKTARMSDLLSRVLLTQQSQALHKIATLEEMVTDLSRDFRFAVENLTVGGSAKPAAEWQVIDAAHYDLNTCLRETIVILKSFIVVLPIDELELFTREMHRERRQRLENEPFSEYKREKWATPTLTTEQILRIRA
jgi:hypothetical protein